ncbi:MAG: class II glutamine amidotransferase [Actinomycetota bacterium]
MCRLYGFRANEPTKVECTLIRAQNALMLQSRGDLRGIEHPDGWGIGYYQDGLPVVERRATAAHADLHFNFTAERVFSQTVIAHVRRATVGAPELTNTHPFTFGAWVFAHNGTVTGIEALRSRLEAEIPEELLRRRLGATDSELAFFWLLARLHRQGVPMDAPCLDLSVLANTVASSVRELAGWCAAAWPEATPRLNFILTDGAALVATRWNNSLCWVRREGVHDCEICGIPHIRSLPGITYRAVVVASEPISHEDWQAVPDHSILVTDGMIRTTVSTI